MANLSDPPTGARSLLPALLLTLLGFGLYAGSLSAPWHFDDMSFIVHDPAVQRLWPIGGHANRPVLTFSLALNNALCGLDPACFRFVNVMIHIGSALLLFGLLRRLLSSGRLGEKAAEGAHQLAFAVAALWMAHPIHTMAVTYIWQRCESLMGMFFIATLYATLRCAEGSRPKLWGAIAMVSIILGLGTKEVMIAVIPVLLIFDAVLLAPSLREALRRRWALYGSSALIITALAVMVASRTSTSQGELGHWTYAASQPGIVLDYIRLSLWPWPLCFDYERPPAQGMLAILLPTIVIGAALGATLWGLKKRSWMGVAAALFFLVLAPTSSFIEINDLMVEYRLYLPLLAPVALLAALSRVIWDRWSPKLPLNAVFLVALCALSLATIKRNQDYSSNVRLWSSTMEAAPNNARAANSLAASYLAANKPGEAIAPARRALELEPNFYSAHVNLGTALKQTGDLEGALTEFRHSLELKPNAKVRSRLGKLLIELDRPENAERQFTRALAKNPDIAEARVGLAQAQIALKHYKAASKTLLSLVERDPTQVDAWFMLGLVRLELERPERAVEAFERAVELDPERKQAWTHLAQLSVKLRRPERAAQAFGHVAKLDPTNLSAQLDHGRALAATGQLNETVRVLRALLAKQPSSAREVGSLASKLARGDSVNKQTAQTLAQLAAQTTRRTDHVTLLHLARVQALTGEAWAGVETIDEILALPSVRGDSKLAASYRRERQALEKYIQNQ